MRITSQEELEEAAIHYGVLPFFRNNIKGFSVEEMTTPGLLFGGNEFEGCWEWKGPVVRKRTTAYGKFFRKKAGWVSKELLPHFLRYRRSRIWPKAGTTDEMIHDIIEINDCMTSTELRESLLGKPRKRTAYDLPDIDTGLPAEGNNKKPSRHILEAPLQRLQMGGWICISDFRYKQTKNGERYGWGVAEYSTPETLFDREELTSTLGPEESLELMVEHVRARYPSASPEQLIRLLAP